MANYINKKVRPVVKWFGGKGPLARRFVELLPDLPIYVEAFAGGLNVLLNRCQAEKEIVGDLNVDLIHLYQTIQTDSATLIERLAGIPYSEEVFLRARDARDVQDPVDRALNFLIKCRMSRVGMGDDFSKVGEDTDFWDLLPPDLVFTAHRLKDVEFYNKPALELIDLFDSPNTVFYLDPPYYPATRASPQVYRHEMSRIQHLYLLKRIVKCQGAVVLSGYENPIYNQELVGWDKYHFEVANRSSQELVQSRRVEVIWLKPAES